MLRRWIEHGRALDAAAFEAVGRIDSPLLDRTVPRLSRAADHAKLYLVVGVAIAALGGSRGKRAAVRGSLAIALASLVSNASIKVAIRRARPGWEAIPLRRRLHRKPRSFSFPSGHSASAAAFATAVGLEHPLAGVASGLLAGAVGFSRVYTGVHYPADVLSGFAIGAGAALATLRPWPRGELVPARMPRSRADIGSGRAETAIAVNAGAGSAGSDLTERIRETFPAATVVAVDGDELAHTLREMGECAGVLGVAGGDGSINTAAEIALERDHPLLIVPAGTLNHLARDVGIASIDEARDALREGRASRVDVATIDGKLFLNTASLGVYPDLVAAREKMEDQIGKWPALMMAMIKVLARAKPMTLEIDGRARSIWMIFIGNCRYEPSGFLPSHRVALDDGLLDVRIVDASRRFARLRLLGALTTGSLSRSKVYEERLVESLRLKTLDGALRLSRDGEVFDGSADFEIRKAPKGVRILAPGSESP